MYYIERQRGQAPQTVAINGLPPKKAMLSLWWGWQGVAYYASQLDKLKHHEHNNLLRFGCIATPSDYYHMLDGNSITPLDEIKNWWDHDFYEQSDGIIHLSFKIKQHIYKRDHLNIKFFKNL